MYATYYQDDDGKKHAVYINGLTGQMSGIRMASQKKGWRLAGIMAAVAVLLLVLGLLAFAAAALFIPASVIGTIFVVLALILGAAAVFPAAWPWIWNNGQLEQFGNNS
jgi:protein-S-isoprenylcysteine O-methyltransferase Ste14